MTDLKIRIPDSLYKSIGILAQREGISVDRFVANAAQEKLAAILTLDYLKGEAAAGKREDFERFLAAVADEPPMPGDELPKGLTE